MRTDTAWELDGRLLDLLTTLGDELGLRIERVDVGAYLVTLTGERRPSTLVWLMAGEQAVAVEAFVMHVVASGCPDPAGLHRWLLRKNLGLRAVHFALDDVGDLFLVGSLPHEALDARHLDRLLGEILSLLEESFPALVQLAYGDRVDKDPALAAKVHVDGAGRRPAGTPGWSPRRDARR